VWHISPVSRQSKIPILFGIILALHLCPWSAIGQEEEDYNSKDVNVDAFVELDVEDEFALLEDSIADDEVESASKHRQSIFWSPSTITVITRDDIYASGATTFTELLRRVPGLDVYQGKYDFPVVGIRAQTDFRNNLVLVLIDDRVHPVPRHAHRHRRH
jgi:outer membrane receptor for monomeric catechols